MKIKILKLVGEEVSTNYDDYRTVFNLKDSTEWTEVTQQEYDALIWWQKNEYTSGYKYIIVSDENVEHILTVNNILKSHYSSLEKIQERKRLQEQREIRKKESQAKRAKKIEENKLKKKQKMLEQLQKELKSEGVLA